MAKKVKKQINKKSQTTTANFPSMAVITSVMFAKLISAGKRGKRIFLWGDENVPPIKVKRVAKTDRAIISAGNSPVEVSLPPPRCYHLDGDKVLCRFNNGVVNLELIPDSTNPAQRIINRTHAAGVTGFFVEHSEPVDVQPDERFRVFGLPFRISDSEINGGKLVHGGEIIAVYRYIGKPENKNVKLLQIIGRGKYSANTIREFQDNMRRFYLHPTNAFAHIAEVVEPTVNNPELSITHRSPISTPDADTTRTAITTPVTRTTFKDGERFVTEVKVTTFRNENSLAHNEPSVRYAKPRHNSKREGGDSRPAPPPRKHSGHVTVKGILESMSDGDDKKIIHPKFNKEDSLAQTGMTPADFERLGKKGITFGATSIPNTPFAGLGDLLANKQAAASATAE